MTRLFEPATHDLTIVVPAYNETERLPSMMESTIKHLTPQSIESKRSFEILIIDDGSIDGTSTAALELAHKYVDCDIKVVSLEKNIGKGGAVRHGMLHAGGERLLMADADGASRIEDLEQLWGVMDDIAPSKTSGVAVGSRAHLVKSEAVVKASFLLPTSLKYRLELTNGCAALAPQEYFDVRFPYRSPHLWRGPHSRYSVWF